MIVIDILGTQENITGSITPEKLIDVRELPELPLQIIEIEKEEKDQFPWWIIDIKL